MRTQTILSFMSGLACLIGLETGLAQAGRICLTDESAISTLPTAPLHRYIKRQPDSKPVDVYFHITSTQRNKDKITDKTVNAQFEVLRNTFQTYGFILNLVNVSRIVDDVAGTGFYGEGISIPDWDAYIAWRTATRRGAYDALNVYFFSDLNPDIGGQCALPTVTEEGSQQFYLDGCWLNGDSMPDMVPSTGNDTTPRKGHTAIHEVGHWFGLLHTFHGRPCESINDQVSDTPAQGSSTTGCPVGKDSCPDSPGLDPIHNFMDYSDDTCTTEFTPGQQARMHQQFDVYRRWEGRIG